MGVVSNNWFDRVLLSISSHVQTLMLIGVQTPFLGTPLVPLTFRTTAFGSWSGGRREGGAEAVGWTWRIRRRLAHGPRVAPEGTKRATSLNLRPPCLQKDLRTGSISLDIVNFPSELRTRGSGTGVQILPRELVSSGLHSFVLLTYYYRLVPLEIRVARSRDVFLCEPNDRQIDRHMEEEPHKTHEHRYGLQISRVEPDALWLAAIRAARGRDGAPRGRER